MERVPETDSCAPPISVPTVIPETSWPGRRSCLPTWPHLARAARASALSPDKPSTRRASPCSSPGQLVAIYVSPAHSVTTLVPVCTKGVRGHVHLLRLDVCVFLVVVKDPRMFDTARRNCKVTRAVSLSCVAKGSELDVARPRRYFGGEESPGNLSTKVPHERAATNL